MSKKVILWFVLMLVVVYIVWIVIINVNDNKLNYEVIEKNGEKLYKVEDSLYKIVDDSEEIMIETSKGLMVVAVYEDDAPITVKNFKSLVKDKFYDGLIFHRVIDNFMIQTGDPTATGSGGSEKTIKGEFESNGVKNSLSHKRGIISMARASSDPETEESYNSATSQFFIVQKDSTYLDGNYASFGLLLKGYDVLDKIAEVSTDDNDKPLNDITIKQMRFVSEYEEK